MAKQSYNSVSPLIVIADDTPKQIELRVTNICTLLGHVVPAATSFCIAGSLVTKHLRVDWDLTDNISVYLDKARGRRTLFLLDIAWPGKPTNGLDIAKAILADSVLRQQSVIMLKSTEVPANAEDFAEKNVIPLRSLRSRASRTRGRLRSLAANSKTLFMPYEQGMIAQALLDLQEETLFDALEDGQWSVADIAGFIEQIAQAQYFGAFKQDNMLGQLYEERVLKRYSQRLSRHYPQGPLNIGMAHVLSNSSTRMLSLKDEVGNLCGRAPTSAALVSALMDYREVAAAELFLFALPLKAAKSLARSIQKEVNTDLNDQPWKPGNMASAGILKRSVDLGNAKQALKALPGFVRTKASEPIKRIEDMLSPKCIPDVLKTNLLITEVRRAALQDLPAAIADLLESVLDEIERAIIEGLPPDSEDSRKSAIKCPPEFLVLEWDQAKPDSLERHNFPSKRARLLNRRIFAHPAVEACRILEKEKGRPEDKIVRAFKAYIQSPEALSALVALQSTDADAFKRCMETLASTDADIRLPIDFKSFDKQWKEYWNGKEPPVLEYLQKYGFSEQAFGEKINAWNSSEAGSVDPVQLCQISLLELLIAHLAILEFRIRSFCIVMGNADKCKNTWKSQLAKNLKELWTARGWDRVFAQVSIIDAERNSFNPGIAWTGQLISVLCSSPKARTYYQYFTTYLASYEIKIEGKGRRGKLSYSSSPPVWLQLGNIVLPQIIIQKNLDNQDTPLLANDRKNAGSSRRSNNSAKEGGYSQETSKGFVEGIASQIANHDPADEEEFGYIREAANATPERAEEIKRFLIKECRNWTRERVDAAIKECMEYSQET